MQSQLGLTSTRKESIDSEADLLSSYNRRDSRCIS